MRKFLFLIILLVAGFLSDFSLFDSIESLDLLSGKKNIVVMGCDVRKDDVGRSDTLFVVMLDKSKKMQPCSLFPGTPGSKSKGMAGIKSTPLLPTAGTN